MENLWITYRSLGVSFPLRRYGMTTELRIEVRLRESAYHPGGGRCPVSARGTSARVASQGSRPHPGFPFPWLMESRPRRVAWIGLPGIGTHQKDGGRFT